MMPGELCAILWLFRAAVGRCNALAPPTRLCSACGFHGAWQPFLSSRSALHLAHLPNAIALEAGGALTRVVFSATIYPRSAATGASKKLAPAAPVFLLSPRRCGCVHGRGQHAACSLCGGHGNCVLEEGSHPGPASPRKEVSGRSRCSSDTPAVTLGKTN
jgi:hypothetical protein